MADLDLNEKKTLLHNGCRRMIRGDGAITSRSYTSRAWVSEICVNSVRLTYEHMMKLTGLRESCFRPINMVDKAAIVTNKLHQSPSVLGYASGSGSVS